MSRDTRDDRPPLRASELPPNHVMLRPLEPRALVCPGCGCWQVPRAGHLRRHGDDRRHGDVRCPEAGYQRPDPRFSQFRDAPQFLPHLRKFLVELHLDGAGPQPPDSAAKRGPDRAPEHGHDEHHPGWPCQGVDQRRSQKTRCPGAPGTALTTVAMPVPSCQPASPAGGETHRR